MQLVPSFSTFLTSFVVALSIVADVDARPVKIANGLATLPLRRMAETRSDVHPQILLQQHINRGHKRLARMTGRAIPSDLELRSNIHKRMYLTGNSPLSRKPAEKRFDRQGLKPVSKAAEDVGNKLKGVVNDPLQAIDGDVAADAEAGFSGLSLEAAINGDLTVAATPNVQNSLGLDIEANDVGYIATIQMGTPPRDFKILMDSGSADFWVGAENCQSEAGGDCGNHTFLGPQSSSSFVDTNKQFQVTYGSGAVDGDIIQDDVTIAGLQLKGHTFGVATTESVEFSGDTTAFDGLMGVAQSTLSNQKVQTPVEALATAKTIPEAIISFKLGRIADGKNDGEVSFGGLDPNKFQANTLTTFDNVNAQGFWEGAMDSVTVNGQDLGLNNRTAILDTGTTLILAPDADAQAVHAAIPGAKADGQGGFTIPCTTTAALALNFGGRDFQIDPRDLAFVPVNPNDLTGDCVSGISSGQIGGAEEWLVGDVFLKNVYFSTDVGKNQISLANLS